MNNITLTTDDLESILATISTAISEVIKNRKEKQKLFYEDINRRLDNAEANYAMRVHQGVQEKAVHSGQQVPDMLLSALELKPLEGQQSGQPA